MKKTIRPLLILFSLLLIGLCWWQLLSIRSGVRQENVTLPGQIPAILLTPQQIDGAAPAALIGHGFAGSQQLMLGYGYTFARAGYITLLWDFDGHGANPNPTDDGSMAANVDEAYRFLIGQPGIDPDRVVILGHSRGSGAAMRAGISTPERYAGVIAISPVNVPVTPELPPNLMLQAGTWEAPFLATAQRLLAEAGGPNPDLSQGLGRALQEIPNAEHASILYRPVSHQFAVLWANAATGYRLGPQHALIEDARIGWYLLHIVAWLLLLNVAAPLIPGLPRVQPLSGKVWRRWLGLPVAVVAGVAGLYVSNQGVPVPAMGGLLVGGAVSVWFAFAGLTWLAFLNWGRPLPRPIPWPRLGRDGLWGLAFLGLLTAAFGLMANWVWVPWWLSLPKLGIWPLLALGMLPWFVAVAQVQAGMGFWRRLLWWGVKSVAGVAGLAGCLVVVPGLYILGIMLPLLPLIFAILDGASAAVRAPLAYGLGSALFFAWMLAAVFPLAG